MKLGLSSWSYTWAVGVPGFPPPKPMTVLDLVQRTHSLGVHVLQIADNLPLDRLPLHELDRLATIACDLGVEIEVGMRGLQPDRVRDYLAIATHLKATLLRLIIDSPEDKPSVPETVERLLNLVPALQAAGVRLGIENHDRLQAREFAEILESVNSDWVGICLDTANSFGALEGPEVIVAALAPWTINLHAKDFTIYRADAMMGFIIEGRPAGQGRMDYRWLLEAVRDNGHNPNAIIELWTPAQATLQESITLEASWAEQSVTYLRQFIHE